MSITKLNIGMRTYPPQFLQHVHCNDTTTHRGNTHKFIDNVVITKIVAGLRFAPPAPNLRSACALYADRLAGKLTKAC